MRSGACSPLRVQWSQWRLTKIALDLRTQCTAAPVPKTSVIGASTAFGYATTSGTVEAHEVWAPCCFDTPQLWPLRRLTCRWRVDESRAPPRALQRPRRPSGRLQPDPLRAAETPAGSPSAPYRPPLTKDGSEVQFSPSVKARTHQSSGNPGPAHSGHLHAGSHPTWQSSSVLHQATMPHSNRATHVLKPGCPGGSRLALNGLAQDASSDLEPLR